MDILLQIVGNTWDVLAEMAPYLLLGFFVAGLMYIWVPTSLVERHLGQRGLSQIVKASLFGIPIPLCSCGVIPVAVSLRRHGAGKGATVSFLSSTPQTGVDSIAVTYALMGPVFTGFRVLAAFLVGLLTGSMVDLFDRDEETHQQAPPCCSSREKTIPSRPIVRALHYGFITLPADIGRALSVGLILSGLMGSLVPTDFFTEHLGSGVPAMIVVMGIGIPFYVCSTASVPIALGLLMAGATPGAAFVFLVTGPATNIATFTTIWKLLGRTSTLIYLAAIMVCALGGGLLLDAIFPSLQISMIEHTHRMVITSWQHAAGVVLVIVLLFAISRTRKN